MREDVRDDAVLSGILGQPGSGPLVPGRFEVGDEAWIVDTRERAVGVAAGLDERSTALEQRVADPLGARWHLRPLGTHAYPYLAGRLVQQTAVAPDDAQRERHRATLTGRESI